DEELLPIAGSFTLVNSTYLSTALSYSPFFLVLSSSISSFLPCQTLTTFTQTTLTKPPIPNMNGINCPNEFSDFNERDLGESDIGGKS
ncbi:MAG: hypothetical protein Q9228_005629, partial [Teloschistes exilis]